MSDQKKSGISTAAPPVLLGITMGCPVGIGPEIILRFLAKRNVPAGYLPVVVGDLGVLQHCAEELQFDLAMTTWQPGEPIDTTKIQVIEPKHGEGSPLQPGNLRWGRPDRTTGQAALAYITEAVHLAQNNVFGAVVTCPIAKHAIQLAGCPFPGHTEMLASLCGTRNFGMMMAGSRLKVSLVTIHESLAQVVNDLNQSEIKRIIHLTGETLRKDFGLAKPRIAVAGFNPHSGESGLFGREEQTIIEPAVTASVSEKWELVPY